MLKGKIRNFLASSTVFLSSFLPLSAENPPPIAWDNYFGGSSLDIGRGVEIDQDGNVYVAVYTSPRTTDLVKYSPLGNQVWVNTYSGYDPDGRISVDSQSNVLLTLIKDYPSSQPAYLKKIDSRGNDIWTRTYGGVGSPYPRGVTVDQNNNIIFFGHVGSPNLDTLVVKYDSNGNYQWDRAMDLSSFDTMEDAVIDSQQNIVAGGFRAGGTGGPSSFLTLKYDPNGNLLWSRTFTSNEGYSNVAYAIGVDSRDDIYVGGSSGGTGFPGDFLVVKYDSNGNYQWNRMYGRNLSERVESLRVDSDNNIYLLGHTNSFGGGGDDFWLVKTDSNGIMLWDKTIGGTGIDIGWHVAVSNDSLVVTGQSNSGQTSSQARTIKFNLADLVDVNVEVDGLDDLDPDIFGNTITRKVNFELYNQGNLIYSTEKDVDFSSDNGMRNFGHVILTVPARDYDCIAAKGKFTLQRSLHLIRNGLNYQADFTAPNHLKQGDLNSDGVVDILDFGTFVIRYGRGDQEALDIADISGNNIVGIEDYYYIQRNFINLDENGCTFRAKSRNASRQKKALTKLRFDNLEKYSLSSLAGADLDGDKTLTTEELFRHFSSCIR